MIAHYFLMFHSWGKQAGQRGSAIPKTNPVKWRLQEELTTDYISWGFQKLLWFSSIILSQSWYNSIQKIRNLVPNWFGGVEAEWLPGMRVQHANQKTKILILIKNFQNLWSILLTASFHKRTVQWGSHTSLQKHKSSLFTWLIYSTGQNLLGIRIHDLPWNHFS